MAINQFMWEWQPHFRISVQSTIERALELVDARLDPRVILVGFADDAATARHPICIEPEGGPLSPEHLHGVHDRAVEIFETDPDRLIIHSAPGLDDSRQRWLQRRARGTAIAEAVEASGTMAGKRVISSTAGHIAGFEVHVCVAVDADPFDALPRLEGEEVNRFAAPGSFVRHLIELALHEADSALDQRSPGMGAIRRRAEDLVAEAAETFAAGCCFRTHNFMSPWVLRPVTRISQRPYEGTGAAGRLVLARPDHPAVEVVARLARPVLLESARGVRKLLETTDDDVALLVHEEGVFGLGRVSDIDAEDVFEITVIGHATWELNHRGVGLLRVSYGVPALPSPIFDTSRLLDAIDRTLGDKAKGEALLPLVHAAAAARHGTTLVISATAPAEAARLSGQATLVEPRELTPDLLAHFSKIDGAVLVDTEGICFAIGVILDGKAEGEGDPARGARFNSAVRYQRSAPAPSVAVVVSEDGDVVHVPWLRPRVRRQDVLDAMTVLEAAAASEDRGQFSEAYDAVRRLGFYLSPEQCERVNELARIEHDRAMAPGGIAIVRRPIKPSPEMRDSYFTE